MAKLVLLLNICAVLACIAAQRITTIQLDGVQYFISRMNPYSPELNYFLAYQYCRSLGLQLASFETKEKVESMSTYLQNAGYSKYDFWTSGNRLGTGMFLWMSTGLPFNATFDYFENAEDSAKAGLLDPVDHNSNTTPQRTARDSNSHLSKSCVMMRGPNLRWTPEDCSVVKDFICEQTRCYYYNYGSIPVSSAQGRPITSLTTRNPTYTTTPMPEYLTSTLASLLARNNNKKIDAIAKAAASDAAEIQAESDTVAEPSEDEESAGESSADKSDDEIQQSEDDEAIDDHEQDEEATEEENAEEEEARALHGNLKGVELVQSLDESPESIKKSETPQSVEQRLKQISEQIEKLGSTENNDGDLGHQSFLSLSDLIKTLRPSDKKVPQIDSDYSNTMRVLGEKQIVAGGKDDSRKLKEASLETNPPVY